MLLEAKKCLTRRSGLRPPLPGSGRYPPLAAQRVARPSASLPVNSERTNNETIMSDPPTPPRPAGERSEQGAQPEEDHLGRRLSGGGAPRGAAPRALPTWGVLGAIGKWRQF